MITVSKLCQKKAFFVEFFSIFIYTTPPGNCYWATIYSGLRVNGVALIRGHRLFEVHVLEFDNIFDTIFLHFLQNW